MEQRGTRVGLVPITAMLAGLALGACGTGGGETAGGESAGGSAEPAEAAPRVEAADIDAALANGALLLDVRTSEELAEHGTIDGFVHIPIDELEARIGELPTGVPILTA